jgi:hypothetical protein
LDYISFVIRANVSDDRNARFLARARKSGLLKCWIDEVVEAALENFGKARQNAGG